MFLFVLIVVVLISLGVLNRKGILDDGEFAVSLVVILLGVAGYLGVSQY